MTRWPLLRLLYLGLLLPGTQSELEFWALGQGYVTMTNWWRY